MCKNSSPENVVKKIKYVFKEIHLTPQVMMTVLGNGIWWVFAMIESRQSRAHMPLINVLKKYIVIV